MQLVFVVKKNVIDRFIACFRDLIPRLETFVDAEVADVILRVFPASLCTTILTVSWMTCEGHGFIAGLVVYYIRVSVFRAIPGLRFRFFFDVLTTLHVFSLSRD